MKVFSLFVALVVCLLSVGHSSEKRVPDHDLAAVLTLNPGPNCSATIVSRGEKWACGVSCAHCFRGTIGGQFKVRFVSGVETSATLLAIDRTHDFARFAVPSSAVLATANIPLGNPDRARYETLGYPADRESRPLVYWLLAPAKDPVQHLADGMVRWRFECDNAGVKPGCSGSGVFANGQLIGVLSHNDGGPGQRAYCSPLADLVAFMRATDKDGCDKWQMGDWSARATNFADAPDAVAEKSNTVLYDCANGRCPRGNRALEKMADVPLPPPPDAGHDFVPDNQKPPAPDLSRDEGIYSGHGKKPDDLSSIKKRAHELDLARHKLRDLEAELHRLKQGGTQGPPGEPGKPGQDFSPPPEPEPKNSLLPAVLAALGAVGVGKFVGYRQGL